MNNITTCTIDFTSLYKRCIMSQSFHSVEGSGVGTSYMLGGGGGGHFHIPSSVQFQCKQGMQEVFPSP